MGKGWKQDYKIAMQRILKRHLPIMISAVAGGLFGYAYWYYIGCLSGSCPIQSNPLASTLYGMGLGGLLGNIIKDWIKKRKHSSMQ